MSVARYWREIPQRYRYEAQKCKGCGYIAFPPRLVCPECGSRDFDKYVLQNTGKIVSFTVIEVGPSEFSDQVPYVVAIIELDDGARITTQIADCDPAKLKIGDKIKIEFRKIQSDGKAGIIMYGYKAVLEK
jgi:uncharacterized OB-fold protein